MKKIILLLSWAVFATFIVGCNDKDEPTTPTKEVNVVSQFVYDGMSTYYKWSKDMQSKKPTATSEAKKYFYTLLHSSDTEHGWSWITDDVDGLLKGFSGESFSFGYNLLFTQYNNKIYAFIKYVFPNTPAANAGIDRLHLIGEINGSPITTVERDGGTYISDASWNVLFGNNAATFTLYKFQDGAIVKDKEVEATPTNISTNPVLKDSIYPVGDKKIGYLFYTGFIGNYNEELFKSFSKFKSKGVNELVLDLRYNRGGAISAASYLASLIAPEAAVKNQEVLSTLSYNEYLNGLFDKNGWSRSSRLGKYNSDQFSNPLDANLNLSKVYIIATSGSYSASELTTFCLQPHMGVVHIGNKTGGKYTASWTLHPYDDHSNSAQPIYDAEKLSTEKKNVLKNWAMQPIVAIYTDKNDATFMEADGLIPDAENTFKEGFGSLQKWTALGDTKDVFLGQALYLITGDEQYKPIEPTKTKAYSPMMKFINAKPANLTEEIQQESVIIDNMQLNKEIMQEIIK